MRNDGIILSRKSVTGVAQTAKCFSFGTIRIIENFGKVLESCKSFEDGVLGQVSERQFSSVVVHRTQSLIHETRKGKQSIYVKMVEDE